MEKEFQNLLKHFYEFARRRIGFDKPASINFVSDPRNSLEPLGKTAYYNPSDFSVTIYTDNRHPKDILRSVAHELVHHKQNCNGQMNNLAPTEPGYAQSDKHLRGLEEEAYLEGNMCFRDWEDEYKTNQEVKTIYESIRKSFTKERLKMKTRGDLRNTVKEAVSKVLAESRLKEMGYDDYDDYEDDPYMSDLEKEFPFLKDNPRKGRPGKAPSDIQRDMDDEFGSDDEDEMMEGMCPTCGVSPCGCPMEEETVAEDASDETFDMVDIVVNALGHEQALEALVQAMSQDEARSNLEYIIRMYELGSDNDLEERSSDPRSLHRFHGQKREVIPKQPPVEDEPLEPVGYDDDEDYESRIRAIMSRPTGETSESIEDEIVAKQDRYGDSLYIIPGVRFTGNIEADVRAMEAAGLDSWLYGELGSDETITDEEGTEMYTGADVQDYLDTSDVVLPDIAETQEDFYTQMRKDARTISEDWNRVAKNKRSALLNERLMKAWNFKK